MGQKKKVDRPPHPIPSTPSSSAGAPGIPWREYWARVLKGWNTVLSFFCLLFFHFFSFLCLALPVFLFSYLFLAFLFFFFFPIKIPLIFLKENPMFFLKTRPLLQGIFEQQFFKFQTWIGFFSTIVEQNQKTRKLRKYIYLEL